MRALALAVLLLASAGPGLAGELPAEYRDAIARLRSSRDAGERAWGAIGLGHGFRTASAPGADPRILDALLEGVALDADQTVQAMAAYSLCLLGDQRGVPRLVKVLRERLAAGGDPQGVWSPSVALPVPYLFRALAHVGGAEAVGFLMDAARQGDRRIRVIAIPALGTVRDQPEEVDGLLTVLARDPDRAVRGVAEFVLAERSRRGPGR